MNHPMVRRTLGIAFALVVTFAIVGLSRVPYSAAPGDHAMIRLSWRMPGEFVEECRQLPQEEMERLPVHMRRTEVCEGHIAPYRLTLDVAGRRVLEETVHAPGARQDRPLVVYREIPVAPGEYRVRVVWEREDLAAGDRSAEARAITERSRLSLDATLRLGTRGIALITYDTDDRMFVARGAGIQRPAVTR